MLGPRDALPGRPHRVLVTGTSGPGKSTLCARLATLLDVPYRELDGVHWGPTWTPRETFIEEVHALAAQPRWVSEWQCKAARPLLGARADLLVWLDLPFALTLGRLVRRTLRRRFRREVLWNENVEPPLATVFTDRDHVVRWAWRFHSTTGQRVHELEVARPELVVVRLRWPWEVEAWIRGSLAHATGARYSSRTSGS